MFYLTEILGLPVYDSLGTKAGRIGELAVALGTQPPRVAMLLLEGEKGKVPSAVPLEAMATLTGSEIRLRIPKEEIRPFHPDESLLLLRKDLLDQQIIDVHGRKVVRVNDLTLEQRPWNHHTELLLHEVDIGLRGALHRLLTGAVPKALLRKLEAHLKPAVISWEFVNLIESDPHRRVKLNISHHLLTKLHPADLADIVEELSHKERQAIIAALDDVTAAEALSEVDPRMQVSIVESMDTSRAADIVEEMPPDAAADLLGDLSEETSSELLEDMGQKEAAELGELLEFHEKSAGGLMNTDYVAIPSACDVQTARSLIASNSEFPKSFNMVFLMDEEGKFAGAVTLPKLIFTLPSEKMLGLRSEPMLSVPADAPEQEVVELFDKYNLLSLPVLDPEQRILGVITVDDIVSLLRKKR